jgi:hypothetical protein
LINDPSLAEVVADLKDLVRANWPDTAYSNRRN